MSYPPPHRVNHHPPGYHPHYPPGYPLVSHVAAPSWDSDPRRVTPPHMAVPSGSIALDRTSPDVWHRRAEDVLGESPFVVRNVMSERVCVHRLVGPGYEPALGRMVVPVPRDSQLLGCVRPGGHMSIPVAAVNPGDRLLLTSLSGDILTDSYELRPNQRHLALGTVMYDPLPPSPAFRNLYAELSGMNVHNHFRFPIDLYGPEGTLLAQNITSRVYVDNVRWGFHVGDWVTVARTPSAFAPRGGRPHVLYRFQIVDPLEKEVHIGVINPEDPVGGAAASTVHP